MDLNEFAEKYRLTIKRDSCNDEVIAGKPRKLKRPEDRCHIYVHSADRFGLAIMVGSVGKWNNRKKLALAHGFEVHQDGRDEGNLLFDPTDSAQSTFALKLAGARKKKVLSPERLAELESQLRTLHSLAKTPSKTPSKGQIFASDPSGRGKGHAERISAL